MVNKPTQGAHRKLMATERLPAVKHLIFSGPTYDLMSINPIAYEDFQTTKTAFAKDGGPWVGINTPAGGRRVYISVAESWCGNCLESLLENTVDDGTVPQYGTYVANISVNMTRYGNANALDFTWGFSPLYTENPDASDTRPIHSEVNNASFDDTMTFVDDVAFANNHSWTGNAISRSGTALVSRDSNNRAYITLTIQYSPLPNPGQGPLGLVFINQWTKDINFKITTPIQSVVPGASTSTGVSSAAIAGVAIGVMAVLIIAGFLLFRRRKRNAAKMLEDSGTVATNYPHAYPVETKRGPGSLALPPTYTPDDAIPMVPSSRETASSYSAIGARAPPTSNYGPPPIYRNAQSVVDMSYDDIPAAPPALAEFANANRNLISDDFEARLAAAGYLPTDDPDNLSEQEWITSYNVTRQELDSLRTLYHSPRQR